MTVLKKFIVLAFCLLLVGGCGLEQEATAGPETFTEVATNLQIPWSINQMGNEFYISERVGTIPRFN